MAVVYNYSPWPAVVAAAHEFAHEHSDGEIICGGDFNLSRRYGTQAFDKLEHQFGWKNILPGPNYMEQPTWPINGPPDPPRQLDHVFTTPSKAHCTHVRVVEPPGNDTPPRLSDHAILHVSTR